MARIEMANERISDYERAICYFSLPRMANPLKVGLVILYSTFLIEAAAVLAWGISSGHALTKQIGAIALGAVIAVGIVAFISRSLFNEVRRRKVLAAAQDVPDMIAGLDEIPDPFEKHLLLRHPLHRRGDLFPCTDREGNLRYFVESAPSSSWWKIKDPQDNELLRVRVEGTANFSLSGPIPAFLEVHKGNEKIAQIQRRFSLARPSVQVHCLLPESKRYTVLDGGIYHDKRLVGRLYYLHQSLYLDVEEAEFDDAILALFVTMT